MERVGGPWSHRTNTATPATAAAASEQHTQADRLTSLLSTEHLGICLLAMWVVQEGLNRQQPDVLRVTRPQFGDCIVTWQKPLLLNVITVKNAHTQTGASINYTKVSPDYKKNESSFIVFLIGHFPKSRAGNSKHDGYKTQVRVHSPGCPASSWVTRTLPRPLSTWCHCSSAPRPHTRPGSGV